MFMRPLRHVRAQGGMCMLQQLENQERRTQVPMMSQTKHDQEQKKVIVLWENYNLSL